MGEKRYYLQKRVIKRVINQQRGFHEANITDEGRSEALALDVALFATSINQPVYPFVPFGDHRLPDGAEFRMAFNVGGDRFFASETASANWLKIIRTFSRS